MKKFCVTALTLITLAAGAALAEETITLFPDRQEGAINSMIYGQFLEHIYDSVVGGLDGQFLYGPSFEESPGVLPHGWRVIQGDWTLTDGALKCPMGGIDCHVINGDPEWGGLDFELTARKENGTEGFLILFRVKDRDNFYWWNLGGWGNTRSAVEHEINGARTVLAETDCPLAIETGRNYQIRIHMDGPLVECWLDQQKICAFEDPASLKGGIGLGVWATGATYSNIRALSNGQDLLAAFKEDKPLRSISACWKGEAADPADRFEWTDQKPLNSRYCQRIQSVKGGARLFQGNLSLKAGRTYVGAIWVRGQAAEAQIGLKTPSARGRLEFPVHSEEWLQIPFDFQAKEDTQEGVFEISLTSAGDIWVDLCLLWDSESIYRESIFKKVAEIQPSFIRWPGGCFAEHYHWKDGIGPLRDRVSRPNYVWGGIDPNLFGTDEFINFCGEVNAEPIMVLNIGHHEPAEKETDYIQEALAWEEYCNGATSTHYGSLRAAHGNPDPFDVRYWEIGNETWPMGAEKYAERACRFVEALRKQNPSLKFLVCGSGGHNLDWNRQMLSLAAPCMDYLSVHHYMQGSFEEEMKNGVEYPAFLEETGKLIAQCANPKIKIAVTEWNQQSIALRSGLYAGLVLNGFERLNQIVEMSCPALFIRKTSFKEWNNAFINHDSDRAFTAPNYLVMKMYRDHWAPVRIGVEGPASLNVSASIEPSSREIILKAVNPSLERNVDARIALPDGDVIAGLEHWMVHSAGIDDQNSLEEPEKIKIEKQAAAGNRVLFPAHSVSLLRIKTGRQEN